MTRPAYTVKQVAEQLGIREHGVLALIHSGQLAAVDVSLTVGGRPRWRILPDDLESFLSRRTHRVAPPRRRRRRKSKELIKEYF